MSEIARVRQQIDLEMEAATQALAGLAAVASHQFITARMERLSDHITALYKAGLPEVAREVLECDDLWNREV